MMKRILTALAAMGVIGGAWVLMGQAPGTAAASGPVLLSTALNLTTAQITGMFSSPVLLIPPQGAGTIIHPVTCTVNGIGGGFTGGGTIAPGFGNTNAFAAGASVPATVLTSSGNTFAASASNTVTNFSTNAINAGIYIANAAAPFAGGTGSSATVQCLYYVVTGMQ